jgi:hypothetical protein
MSSSPLQVVIAGGTGEVGRALAQVLGSQATVRCVGTRAPAQLEGATFWPADLFSIFEAEVALAGADVCVFLARASRPHARLVQAAAEDLDLLLADSVARAAPRTSVKRLVLYACGKTDPREATLRASGLPVQVLRSAESPVEALARLVIDASVAELGTPTATVAPERTSTEEPDTLVCSVQRYPLPAGWTARDVAQGYLGWLPSALRPLVRVRELHETHTLSAAGTDLLKLRYAKGRSEAASYLLDVADGAFVRRGVAPGRFEFRVLLGRGEVMVSLQGFSPSLPWPVYRITQAIAHARVMRAFGRWLAEQPARQAA